MKLTNSEKEQIRQRLSDLDRELRCSQGDRDVLTTRMRQYDTADMALSLLAQEEVVRRSTLNHGRLKEVAEAQRRLEEGTYGICLSCDEEIPARRLVAIVEASLCCACQSKREQASKGGRHRMFTSEDQVQEAEVSEQPA